MKELLEFIVTNLVENKENVTVDVKENGEFIDCLVTVSGDDFGKVVGRNGKIATAIRTLVRAAGRKLNKRANVKITKVGEASEAKQEAETNED